MALLELVGEGIVVGIALGARERVATGVVWRVKGYRRRGFDEVCRSGRRR